MTKQINPPQHGLPERTVKTMQAIFTRYAAIEKVILYGSRAMGNYKNGSDIDLTMYGENLNYDLLTKIHGELDDSSIPYMVDLSVFSMLDHEQLKEHIARVGVVFYTRDASGSYFMNGNRQ